MHEKTANNTMKSHSPPRTAQGLETHKNKTKQNKKTQDTHPREKMMTKLKWSECVARRHARSKHCIRTHPEKKNGRGCASVLAESYNKPKQEMTGRMGIRSRGGPPSETVTLFSSFSRKESSCVRPSRRTDTERRPGTSALPPCPGRQIHAGHADISREDGRVATIHPYIITLFIPFLNTPHLPTPPPPPPTPRRIPLTKSRNVVPTSCHVIPDAILD